MLRKLFWMSFVVAALAAPSSRADDWDVATDNDNGIGTDNSLAHGVEQVHDLAGQGVVADQDWYRVAAAARSSYEVVIDNETGDLNLIGDKVARLADDGTTVLQSSVNTDGLDVLRWENGTTALVNFVRVQGPLCGTSCTASDQYRIRLYDTTYSIPRFNNSGGQVTVLNVASVASSSCNIAFHFFDGNGVSLGVSRTDLIGRELKTINTSALTFAADKSGWIIVTHTCGYGGLTGKAVAVEPLTGFTFDTPLLPRVL